MLHGFQISQFRNFGDEKQTVGPLDKINIFIGGNNSGKSNVLRFVRDVIAPIVNRGPKSALELGAINRCRFSGTPHNCVGLYTPIDEIAIAKAFSPPNEGVKRSWADFFRQLPGTLADGTLTLVPLSKSLDGRKKVDDAALDATGVNQQIAQRIWATAGSSGGGFAQHWYPDIIQRLYESNSNRIDCLYVPSFRQLDTRLSEFKDEYQFRDNEQHIIDELSVFYSPTYGEQEKRKSFDKLRDFIADIAGCPDIRINISHDRKAINVNMHGEVMPIEALGSGIHELFMLASRIVLSEGKLILLE